MIKNLTFVFTLTLLSLVTLAKASSINVISGKVVNNKTKESIIGASIEIEENSLWAVTDKDGKFTIHNIDNGDYHLIVSYLGYLSQQVEVSLTGANTPNIVIELQENSLEIDQVVVTSQPIKEEVNTSYEIGREALTHMQVSDVSSVASLLPGGKTINPDLTTDNSMSIRGGGTDSGNAAFGVAIEVDGVRMNSNASFGELGGSSTRNVAVDNIESIEVITGVPSVEYGDVNSGVVKVKTRRGYSPLNVTLTTNPRTYQVSASQGILLNENGAALNVSAEWARATKSLISPYESYTRSGGSLVFSNTFAKKLKLEVGATINIGGSNSKDDPDAYTGEYKTGKDDLFKVNSTMSWLLNKKWITNLKFDISATLNDKTKFEHLYNSQASRQPSVHSESEGYYIADMLPYSYFSDGYIESKEVNLASSLKYELNNRFGDINSRFKLGVQWKTSGNIGRGEYFKDMATAPTGFRERDYSEYPYMHNLSIYAEERLTIPIGNTSLTLVPGVRMEKLILEGTQYKNALSFSPRFNGQYKISDIVNIHGGWGVTEKLPSFYVLYPLQEYRDIRSSDFSYGDESLYVYYTQPYKLEHNPDLKWQRNINSELGIDLTVAGIRASLTGFRNRTIGPYQYTDTYSPFSYNIYQKPTGFEMPANPQIKVDSQSGQIYILDNDNKGAGWQNMELSSTYTTFTKSSYADNGAEVNRQGLELVVDLPMIKPIKTQFRVDATYSHVEFHDDTPSYYYNAGLTSSVGKGPYQYVGIYAVGKNNATSIFNGYINKNLDANVTAITHISAARLIISCRVEMSLYDRRQKTTKYNGTEYAQRVDENGNEPLDGSVYDGGSYSMIYPIKYMDTEGNIHDFTEVEASDPAFSKLILKSGNAYAFDLDGYDPYVSANLSITKEIGDNVSLSFYANNFTNSRRAVTSYATGISAIFVPNFYYGLTARIKF